MLSYLWHEVLILPPTPPPPPPPPSHFLNVSRFYGFRYILYTVQYTVQYVGGNGRQREVLNVNQKFPRFLCTAGNTLKNRFYLLYAFPHSCTNSV